MHSVGFGGGAVTGSAEPLALETTTDEAAGAAESFIATCAHPEAAPPKLEEAEGVGTAVAGATSAVELPPGGGNAGTNASAANPTPIPAQAATTTAATRPNVPPPPSGAGRGCDGAALPVWEVGRGCGENG